jgi:DNA-binding NtrC family response regulator
VNLRGAEDRAPKCVSKLSGAELAACPRIPLLERAMTNKSVLVVDDEPGFRQVVSQVLQHRGYDVVEVAGAQEALTWCTENPRSVSVVLADVCMPTMNGPELAGEMGRHHPEIPVVLMSGCHAHRHGRPKAPFIQKPFRTDELVRLIDSAIQSGLLVQS